MLWPAESIYDGTWASGPAPAELIDFELMREMHWSWEQLEATPLYVRRYAWDLMLTRRRIQREKDKQANS
ncbi:hypothetical protein [Streptacidiphilus sp. MAP5-3]|uniref:hypothetical protein n=1 Tax=unclassified Streptacidiphilus TaxID=2643834 RepID=UPI003516D947